MANNNNYEATPSLIETAFGKKETVTDESQSLLGDGKDKTLEQQREADEQLLAFHVGSGTTGPELNSKLKTIQVGRRFDVARLEDTWDAIIDVATTPLRVRVDETSSEIRDLMIERSEIEHKLAAVNSGLQAQRELLEIYLSANPYKSAFDLVREVTRLTKKS